MQLKLVSTVSYVCASRASGDHSPANLDNIFALSPITRQRCTESSVNIFALSSKTRRLHKVLREAVCIKYSDNMFTLSPSTRRLHKIFGQPLCEEMVIELPTCVCFCTVVAEC